MNGWGREVKGEAGKLRRGGHQVGCQDPLPGGIPNTGAADLNWLYVAVSYTPYPQRETSMPLFRCIECAVLPLDKNHTGLEG